MRLLTYSVAVLSMVGLSRAGCTENQFGKDGCEPEPFLCRQFLLKSVASCVFFLSAFHFRNESFLSTPGLSAKKALIASLKKLMSRRQLVKTEILPFLKILRASTVKRVKKSVPSQTRSKMTQSGADSGDL